MTPSALAGHLDALDAAARAASTAELAHQRDAARRAAELKSGRAFAWRRLNLVRAVAGAVRAAENAPAAAAAGSAAMLREAGLSGAAEAERAVAARFEPVALAIWAAGRDAPEAGDPVAELAGFESWYAAARGAPFLALMEREIVELPLVEV